MVYYFFFNCRFQNHILITKQRFARQCSVVCRVLDMWAVLGWGVLKVPLRHLLQQKTLFHALNLLPDDNITEPLSTFCLRLYFRKRFPPAGFLIVPLRTAAFVFLCSLSKKKKKKKWINKQGHVFTRTPLHLPLNTSIPCRDTFSLMSACMKTPTDDLFSAASCLNWLCTLFAQHRSLKIHWGCKGFKGALHKEQFICHFARIYIVLTSWISPSFSLSSITKPDSAPGCYEVFILRLLWHMRPFDLFTAAVYLVDPAVQSPKKQTNGAVSPAPTQVIKAERSWTAEKLGTDWNVWYTLWWQNWIVRQLL